MLRALVLALPGAAAFSSIPSARFPTFMQGRWHEVGMAASCSSTLTFDATHEVGAYSCGGGDYEWSNELFATWRPCDVLSQSATWGLISIHERAEGAMPPFAPLPCIE